MRKIAISATITPLLEDQSLDREGLANLLERNIRHGLDGVFLLGSMGEWNSFDDDFKEEYVCAATEIVSGRMKVLAGINATSLELSLQNLERYRKYPVDAFVYMQPGKPCERDPVESILTVLEASDRPVFYYYCPPNNGVTLTLDQFAEIMAHPRLAGIKNSASNMWLRRELLLLKRERGFSTLLFEGQEWSVDEALLAGCDGMVCGMGALASKAMVALAKAAERNDWAEAVRQQEWLIRIFHGIYGPDLSTVWNGQKYALMKLGLITSPLTLAQEMSSLDDAAKARIDRFVEEHREELD
ncbi:MAG: dihydrodipicolinate synthase family protein [Victivallales bacterium]|nr:dihydrodipicolinate synthase family protein [Victivallales bacterium]